MIWGHFKNVDKSAVLFWQREINTSFLMVAVENISRRKNRASGVAISVVTEPENIHGEYGVLSNHQQRGKNWERLAYIAVEKGYRLLENSAAGIRLHGGESRDPSLEKHSYRLYFRKKYGVQWLNTSKFFPNVKSLRTLVVHVDIPEEWPLNNAIANRVYGMVGVPTIEYSQAEFFLNGENQGLYWLSPHLSEKYILERYDLNKIHYQRYRGQSKNPIYREDIARVESEEFKPLTYDALSEVIDVEGLVNYFIAVTYSGNTDWNQGVGFKDAEDQNSRWKWVAWDLDHSFIDWYRTRSRNPEREVWQQDGLGLIFNHRLHKVRSKRQRFFRRLFVEDPHFQKRFVKRYVDVLNHDLRIDKLIALYAQYDEIIAGYGRQINPLLLGFFKNRHAHMRWELQQYFDLPDFHEITVEGNVSQQVSINGYVENLPFTGYYPAGTELTLQQQTQEGAEGGTFYINGKSQPSGKAVFTLGKPSYVTLG